MLDGIIEIPARLEHVRVQRGFAVGDDLEGPVFAFHRQLIIAVWQQFQVRVFWIGRRQGFFVRGRLRGERFNLIRVRLEFQSSLGFAFRALRERLEREALLRGDGLELLRCDNLRAGRHGPAESVRWVEDRVGWRAAVLTGRK